MASRNSSHSACAIRTAASALPGTDANVRELAKTLGAGDFQHIIAFFSIAHDPSAVAAALSAAFPGVPVSGCSTAGEITPAGMTEGGILLIAFPREGFRIVSGVIEDVGRFGVERATGVVRKLKARFGADGALKDRVFALMLVDGLSQCEETLVAAIHWVMDDIQLIGGSAGDGLSFAKTALLHEGRVVGHAAVLLLIESERPFHVFKTQNFDPSSIKLVVTGADTENRRVTELNAEPAAHEYASAIGLLPADLGPFSFASYPLVVKVGGGYYCRSIRNMNADGSLSFFCAIDEGLVFTVAHPQDIVRATAATLDSIEAALGGIDLILGFDCVLRRLDAENRQLRAPLEALYRKHRVVGFHTYGEQFNSMHLNQTLTGIAFGRGAARP